MPRLTRTVSPYWTPTTMPHFYKRTDVVFAKAPTSTITDRGIENRLFNSIVAGLPTGAYIAGGFMVSVMQEDTKAKDIDIFFTSEEAFKAAFNLLKNPPDDEALWAWKDYKIDPNEETNFNSNPTAFRFVKFVHEKRPPIQLVKLVWYADPYAIIDSFDFTITQFAADKENIYFNPVSFLDLARKRLVLHQMQFPASSLRRLIKYTSKGYYACEGSLIKIANDTAKVIKELGGEVVNQEVYID